MRPYTEVLWEWFLLHAEASQAWFRTELSDTVMTHLRQCGVDGDRPQFIQTGNGDTKLACESWQCSCGAFATATTFMHGNRLHVLGALVIDDAGLTEAELAYRLVAYEQATGDEGGDLIERLRGAYG